MPTIEGVTYYDFTCKQFCDLLDEVLEERMSWQTMVRLKEELKEGIVEIKSMEGLEQ